VTPQEIFALFGRTVVLLRVAPRAKRPIDPKWEDLTAAEMTPAYLASLNGNIGILHGAASGHLIGIEFDSIEAAKLWFRANPWAKDCLWSKAKRGPCFWVFIKGPYPKSHNLYDEEGNQVGEWRADGRQTVFTGTHPDGMTYVHKGTPPTLAYADVVWPKGLRLTKPEPPVADLDAQLQADHGPPFWVDQFGNVTKINQKYLANRFCVENLVLFEQDEGSFFRYLEGNGAWSKVVSDVVKKMTQDEWTRLVKLWGANDLHKKVSNGAFNAITDLVRSISGRTQVFKPLKRIIHCNNTMLHLIPETGEVELHDFNPEYYARNPCPINWNPEATCPQFQGILDTMEPADADLFLRYAANVLLGGNPSQQILLLVGEAGTSKSALCEIIELVVGRRNVAELRTQHLDKQFEIGRYIGKTLLTGKDVKGDFLESEGAARIKALTGHDSLTGEIKHESGTPEIYGNFSIIIVCNENLTIKLEGDTDLGAWARRLIIINFTEKSKHKETIVDYGQKVFAEEGEGILVLIVKAAFRHLKELAAIGAFNQTSAQKARVEDLLAESRSIEMFVKECVFKRKGCDISSDELVKAYIRYCELHGWRPVEAPKFQKYVVSHMVRHHQSSVGTHCIRENNGKEGRVRGYPGVFLMEEDDQATDGSETFDQDSNR
jgi:P4 family phage/plasmid primase-like protien